MMRRNGHPFDFWNSTRLVVFLSILLFMIFPFSSLIINSFHIPGKTGLSLDNFKDFFTLPYYYRTLFNSLT
ncbi:MAG: iron ABC transporter permease, partial [Sphaerochaetaceae bacterium]